MSNNSNAAVDVTPFDVPAFSSGLMQRLVACTRLSSKLSSGNDYRYRMSISNEFRRHTNSVSDKVLTICRRLASHRSKGAFTEGESLVSFPCSLDSLQSSMDVLENFDVVIDWNDTISERVDEFLDDPNGEKRKRRQLMLTAAAINDSTNNPNNPHSRSGKKHNNSKNMIPSMFDYYSTIPKSQLLFNDPPNNVSACFIPKLISKPNAIVPLKIMKLSESITDLKNSSIFISPTLRGVSKDMENHIRSVVGKMSNPGMASPADSSISINDDAGDDAIEGYAHPYEVELRNLVFPSNQLGRCQERLYRSLETTKLTWVNSPSLLESLVVILNRSEDFAIDLENHSFRSFPGFCCLMQISTRDEDFVIDTLALRSHMHILLYVFTNPMIIKIMHGADSDIVWLQRDFGLYIVNMFDTGQAARTLEFPSFSLAYLLKYFCNVTVDKTYQTADWRLRPIPPVMMNYAREDTHYLLYVADRLKNLLIDKGNSSNTFLLTVLNRSKDVCLKRYENEIITSSSHMNLYNRHTYVFSDVQMSVFSALYKWRDTLARDMDESTGYILPNASLFQIAEYLPHDAGGVISVCSSKTPMIRSNAVEIAQLVQKVINDAKSDKQNEIPAFSPGITGIGLQSLQKYNMHIAEIQNGESIGLSSASNAITFSNSIPSKSQQRPSLFGSLCSVVPSVPVLKSVGNENNITSLPLSRSICFYFNSDKCNSNHHHQRMVSIGNFGSRSDDYSNILKVKAIASLIRVEWRDSFCNKNEIDGFQDDSNINNDTPTSFIENSNKVSIAVLSSKEIPKMLSEDIHISEPTTDDSILDFPMSLSEQYGMTEKNEKRRRQRKRRSSNNNQSEGDNNITKGNLYESEKRLPKLIAELPVSSLKKSNEKKEVKSRIVLSDDEDDYKVSNKKRSKFSPLIGKVNWKDMSKNPTKSSSKGHGGDHKRGKNK